MRRKVFQHAGVLQDEGDIRTGFGEAGRILHLRCEHLQIEAEAVIGEPRDVTADLWIGTEVWPGGKAIERVVVPVQLHADAAHQRIARQTIELGAGVIDTEIGIGDDGVRPAVVLRGFLHPGGFVLEAIVGPIGLDID